MLRHPRALPLALALLTAAGLAAVPRAPAMDEDFQRGMTEGMAFGEQVGKKKGKVDGKRSGDREGYAAGLRDAEQGIDNPEDPGQPPTDPPPPTEPPPPPDPVDPPPEPVDPPPEPTEPPEPTPPPEPTDFPPEPTEPPPPEAPGDQAPLPIAPEDIEAYALSQYPELVPRAADGSRMAKARDFLGDPQTQKAMRYSAGFAAGFAQAFSAAKKKGYKEAYRPAFRRGYARGQADWRRRSQGEDGQPLTPQQQYDKALAEYRRGKFDEAADRFDMVLAGGADGELAAKALYGMARCQFRSEAFRDARATARRLTDTLPDSELADDGAYLAALCRERIRTGGFLGFGKKPDRKAAADDFEGFTRAFPDSDHAPEAYFRLAHLAARLKQKVRAVEALRTMLDRWPDHPLAPRAQRLLRSLVGGRRKR